MKWIGERSRYRSRRCGIRADQAVQVARLELVRVRGQRLEVADAVVAGAGLEDVAEGQRAQRGVAAGAAAADRQALAVDLARAPPDSARR